MKSTPSRTKLTRRSFLKQSTAVLATVSVVPSYVLGLRGQTPPSEKLNLAVLGFGGRARAVSGMLKSQNIIAISDCDTRQAASGRQRCPQAKFYQDYRRLLDAHDHDLDGVAICSPDNTHAMLALAAMERGKHVYCEKPLAHSIGQARAMAKAAAQSKVITQMGNQGHSSGRTRDFCEWIWDGAIGNVHTVYGWCGSNYSSADLLPQLAERPEVPKELNWDLWVGPAKYHPFQPFYLHGKWRSWSAFGTGVIGDWVCHVIDPSFWALDLGAPSSVLAEADNFDPKTMSATFPSPTKVTYQFPAKGKRGPVKLVWMDGGAQPGKPSALDADDKLPRTGALVIGDEGVIVHGSHGASQAWIYPESRMDAYTPPAPTLKRVKGSHADDWIQSIRAGVKAGSKFEYGARLAEIALIGVIAIRFLGRKLEWDGNRFTNCDEANPFVNPPWRALRS